MMREIWRNIISTPGGVTIIGGGGKTSLMYYLLKIFKDQGAVGTATAKLSSQQKNGCTFVSVQSLAEACRALEILKEKGEYNTLLYREENHVTGKMTGISSEWIDELALKYPNTLFIVEGDGSAGKPLKGHLAHEPVIPSCSAVVVAVIGIDSIGIKINSQHVHRPERICQLTGAEANSLVSIPLIIQLLFHPEGYLHTCPKHSRVIIFINKAESVIQQQRAEELAQQILAQKHPQVQGVVIGSLRNEEGLWLQV